MSWWILAGKPKFSAKQLKIFFCYLFLPTCFFVTYACTKHVKTCALPCSCALLFRHSQACVTKCSTSHCMRGQWNLSIIKPKVFYAPNVPFLCIVLYSVMVLFEKEELTLSSPVKDSIIIYIHFVPLSQQDSDIRWFCFLSATYKQIVVGFKVQKATYYCIFFLTHCLLWI